MSGNSIGGGIVPQASLAQFVSSTGPGAGATIGQIVAPPPGLYQIEVYFELSGAITAAEQDNLRLNVNGVQVCRIPMQALPITGVVQSPFTVNANVPAGNISLVAVAAAGAAAVYSGTIVATRIA